MKIEIHEIYSLFGSEDGKWEKENEERDYHFGLFGRKENERGKIESVPVPESNKGASDVSP